MNPATLIALLQVVMGLVGDIPELIAAMAQAIKLLQTGTAPTPDEQAVLDSGLAAAHAALQGS